VIFWDEEPQPLVVAAPEDEPERDAQEAAPQQTASEAQTDDATPMENDGEEPEDSQAHGPRPPLRAAE
jgi:hypothetical protein